MKFNSFVINKSLLCAVLTSATLGASLAHANDSESFTINLTASVPAESFQVIPVDSGWITQTQTMGYDIANNKLQPFEKQFQYKNSSGAIQATLIGNLNTNGEPQLSNGTDVIPLSVSFNNIALSNTAQTVVTDAAGKAGGRTALKIEQADTAELAVNGSFTGSVAMLFEPVVTTTP